MQAHGGEPLIPFSGAFESKLFGMPDDEKAAYCKEVRTVAPTLFSLYQLCWFFAMLAGHDEAPQPWIA